MRVALVSQEYPPETAQGGLGTQTRAKAHGLAALGHEVVVISHSVDGVRHLTCDGAVEVLRIPGLDASLPLHSEPARWVTYSTAVAEALWGLHSRVPLDLVDFPDWGSEGFVHLLNRSRWNHIPSVVHLHGPLVMLAHALGWPELDSELYRVGTAMEAACVRLADRVYSSSHCSVGWCAEHYGLDPEAVPVIHTGIDTERFRPLELPREDHPTLLFVGRLARNKGVFELLEAACRLAGELPDLRLRMIGGGERELEARLVETARDRGAPAGLLELVGFVEPEALPEQLSRAHLFAAPSAYEGGPGFVYLEAMACGLPVIACEGLGAAEAVLHGKTGLLVPPGDVAALTGAIRRLLLDPAERERLGLGARRHVEQHAERRQCIRRIEAFYATVVRSHGAQA